MAFSKDIAEIYLNLGYKNIIIDYDNLNSSTKKNVIPNYCYLGSNNKKLNIMEKTLLLVLRTKIKVRVAYNGKT